MTEQKQLSFIFAQNVKTYRRSAGLTQEELANLTGLHRTYIGGIESDSRNVSLSAVEKIAKGLSIDASLLLKDRTKNGQ